MRIENGILDVAEQAPSPNHSGRIKPTKVVIHFTGGTDGKNAVRWLKNPKAKASAHFVIDAAGNVTQLVRTDRKAWHAGRSRWGKREGVNRFSVGIELVNAGLLEGSAPGPFTTRIRKDQIPAKFVSVVDGRGWHKYATPQIRALLGVIRALKAEYPAIDELVGHEDVAPKRKIDPGPAFPWDYVSRETQTAFRGKPPAVAATTALALPAKPLGMPMQVYEMISRLWFWYQSRAEGDGDRAEHNLG
jgi:N-acetylmuramoyl-L-alanine amidase